MTPLAGPPCKLPGPPSLRHTPHALEAVLLLTRQRYHRGCAAAVVAFAAITSSRLSGPLVVPGLTTWPSHALTNALDKVFSFFILSSMPANHASFTDTLPHRPPPCCWQTTEPRLPHSRSRACRPPRSRLHHPHPRPRAWRAPHLRSDISSSEPKSSEPPSPTCHTTAQLIHLPQPTNPQLPQILTQDVISALLGMPPSRTSSVASSHC
jgi:hypothetical protein